MSHAEPRKIIHIDMDCFYAAIEERDRPELRGRPLAVGGRSRRSVLTTANYEARKYGVHSAMPTWMAMQKCPQLVVVPTRFEVYRRDSARIRAVFERFTELVEPLSLDEAYLDVTHLAQPGSAVAAEIRGRIFDETQLTASAGIGPNKLLAKIASDLNKPNGQFEVKPQDVPAFITPLPVRKLWGVGHVTSGKMEKLGAKTCGDLQRFSRAELCDAFGKFGLELYDQCRGIDRRAVEPHRERKSLSVENTFEFNLETLADCEDKLALLFSDLLAEISQLKSPREIHKLFVKLKFADFTRTTVERVGSHPSLEQYRGLLAEGFRRKDKPVRLLGVGVRFAPDEDRDGQLDLTL